MFKLSLI